MKLWMTLTLALFSSLAVPVVAEQQVGSIKERAQYLKEFKALLQADDEDIRIAAFDEGIRSDDTIIKSATMELALKSDDKRLQTAGLRQLFKIRDKFIVTMELPANPSDVQKAIYEQLSILDLSNVDLDESNDEISAREWQGHLMRGGLLLYGTSGDTINCKISALASGGTALVGAVECNLKRDGVGSLPIVIELS